MKAKALVPVALFVGILAATAVCGQPAGLPGLAKAQDAFRQKIGEAEAKHFEGVVVSHDIACHCLVVESATGTLTLQEDYAEFDAGLEHAKGLEVGTRVSGTYKTVDYIDYALDIREWKR